MYTLQIVLTWVSVLRLMFFYREIYMDIPYIIYYPSLIVHGKKRYNGVAIQRWLVDVFFAIFWLLTTTLVMARSLSNDDVFHHTHAVGPCYRALLCVLHSNTARCRPYQATTHAYRNEHYTPRPQHASLSASRCRIQTPLSLLYYLSMLESNQKPRL